MKLLGACWLVLLVVSACGGERTDAERICDAIDCTDRAYEECESMFEEAQTAARDNGCDDQLAALVRCIDEELECDESAPEFQVVEQIYYQGTVCQQQGNEFVSCRYSFDDM
jgi:hypothetical protein